MLEVVVRSNLGRAFGTEVQSEGRDKRVKTGGLTLRAMDVAQRKTKKKRSRER